VRLLQRRRLADTRRITMAREMLYTSPEVIEALTKKLVKKITPKIAKQIDDRDKVQKQITLN
jgi:hypothetical protein